jgi:hypothetical protein
MKFIPQRGIERAASRLLQLDALARKADVSPKYMRHVNIRAFEEAAAVVHDMGYGMTPSMVCSAVYETTNEGGNFLHLAAKLEGMKA